MQRLDRLLAEWESLRPASADADLEAVRLAIVVEDVLGVTLTDEQMSHSFLLDRHALLGLLTDTTTH